MDESVRLALVGLDDSLARLDEAIQERNRDRIFVAIGEGLVWANAADETLAKADDPAYSAGRDADEEGQVLHGLRWARNQNLHALIAVHETGSGMRFPMTFPMSFSFSVFWQSPDDLPPVGRPQADNEAAYRRIVNQAVLGTLRQASAFLWRTASL